jgi:hypothetical protein
VGQTEPELLGWNIRHDANIPRRSATTVLQTKRGTGPQSFLTLLLPMRAGSSSPVKSVRPSEPDSAIVTLNDGRSFAIVADPEPNGGIEVTETLSNSAIGRHVKISAATAQVAAAHL